MSTIRKLSRETEDDSQGQKTDSAENRSYNTDGVESKLLQSTAKSGKWVRMQSVRPVHTHFLEINLGQKRALLGEESDSELLTKKSRISKRGGGKLLDMVEAGSQPHQQP